MQKDQIFSEKTKIRLAQQVIGLHLGFLVRIIMHKVQIL